MQEVFSKIIEKLEEYEYENLVEHDSEQSQHCKDVGDCGMLDCSLCVFDKAIEIVKQEAEKYNNGWIPCSERLPEEHDSMFARFKGTDKWRDSMFEKTSNEVTVTIADEKGEKATTHAHTTDGTWKCDILRACPTYRVIAWQTLPDPYHQSGEYKKKTNFDRCCESIEAMAQIIDIAKIGWTKDQIVEWLQKEAEE